MTIRHTFTLAMEGIPLEVRAILETHPPGPYTCRRETEAWTTVTAQLPYPCSHLDSPDKRMTTANPNELPTVVKMSSNKDPYGSDGHIQILCNGTSQS